MADTNTTPARAGIVLSGGGARGAYEAGVTAGIIETLVARGSRHPFSIFTGTSVGAINAAWLAAHADCADLCVGGLLEQWRALDLGEHLRISPRRFLLRGRAGDRLGRSLVDPRALEKLVGTRIPFERLHANVDAGLVHALVIAAFNVGTTRTTMFAELAEGASFKSSRDARRVAKPTRIRDVHVLASAAIPLVFPARRIGTRYYCDGGIRFNTPLAPAIRTGADRLLVVSALHQQPTGDVPRSTEARHTAAYPSPLFLMGKVLTALLLDPLDHDVAVMDRINRLWRTLETTLEPAELHRIQDVLRATRGAAYREVRTLVFHPSEDIGEMAAAYARETRHRSLTDRLFAALSTRGNEMEADLLSFLLFDGGFATQLIELGRGDARRRADEVCAFFASEAS